MKFTRDSVSHFWTFFAIITGNFQESAEALEGDVVVQLARGEEVVLHDGVVEDGGAVGGDGLLVGLEQRLELDQVRALDQPVQVHLFQNGVGGQLQENIE